MSLTKRPFGASATEPQSVSADERFDRYWRMADEFSAQRLGSINSSPNLVAGGEPTLKNDDRGDGVDVRAVPFTLGGRLEPLLSLECR
jgi:hypothetical protein